MDPERPFVSPMEKRASRAAARQGDRIRRREIASAMQASYADADADMSNWLDQAAAAYPGGNAALFEVFGLARRAIDQLAEVTRTDPEAIVKRLLR